MAQPPLGASIWQAIQALSQLPGNAASIYSTTADPSTFVGRARQAVGSMLSQLLPHTVPTPEDLRRATLSPGQRFGEMMSGVPTGSNQISLGMMPTSPGKLPPLPNGWPTKAVTNLFAPGVPLPEATGNPEVPGDLHVQYPSIGNARSVGEASMSAPGAWKPVLGVKQNLGPLGNVPVQNSKQALANEAGVGQKIDQKWWNAQRNEPRPGYPNPSGGTLSTPAWQPASSGHSTIIQNIHKAMGNEWPSQPLTPVRIGNYEYMKDASGQMHFRPAAPLPPSQPPPNMGRQEW